MDRFFYGPVNRKLGLSEDDTFEVRDIVWKNPPASFNRGVMDFGFFKKHFKEMRVVLDSFIAVSWGGPDLTDEQIKDTPFDIDNWDRELREIYDRACYDYKVDLEKGMEDYTHPLARAKSRIEVAKAIIVYLLHKACWDIGMFGVSEAEERALEAFERVLANNQTLDSMSL